VVDLRALQREVDVPYRNQMVLDVDDHCMRLSVFEGEYRWHRHPHSDELFLMVEGALRIEFADGGDAVLRPWQCLTVPAGTVHRIRGVGRTVDLTVERQAAETVFVEAPSRRAAAPHDARGRDSGRIAPLDQ
jgi:mannose-6-phosphate isomerase-like protein (cupin superfamily)